MIRLAPRRSLRPVTLGSVVALLASLVVAPMGAMASPGSPGGPVATSPVEVSAAVHHDVSPPLRNLRPSAPGAANLRERPLLHLPGPGGHGPDGALQTTAGPAVATTAGLGFAGIGQGDYGFSDMYAPPDTNGAVGATQYVQWVNVDFAVFDKATGKLLYGPVPGNTLWSGFGGGCQTNDDGDPIVQYDKLANRWIMTQFSVSTTPYLQCVAVSTTSDATGSWNRYAFSYGSTQFPDYPKLGVWPDGYYVTYNIFNNGTTFAGAKACAFDRTSMLAGAAATQQCFQLSTSYGGLLPSDLDGTTPPPAGSPDFFLSYGSSSLNLWRFHVDWAAPANTTFSGPSSIAVASFSPACNGGTCIPQPSTRQTLDSLADRLMYRLAYRHLADGHEALVVNHSVTAGTSVGVRWYELRNATGSTMASATPVVFQQGTFAPDATYRWMGSIAMDQAGDIALGYSASSSSVYPSVRYTGRVPTDPLGTMEAETTVKAGTGSQTQTLSRWGDYSAMSVDPVDDCTFWYTNEYLKTSGTFDWSTWITSFKFPGCGSTSGQVLTSISVSPPSASVPVGGTQQFTATAYDQSGQVMNPQPAFTWSVSGGGTISGSGLFSATTVGGPYTVTASSGGVSGTASVSVTATAPSAPQNLTATPGNASVALSWQAPSSDGGAMIQGYAVYRGTSSGGEGSTPIATVTSGTSYTDTSLTNGTAYYYTVAAYNSVGTGPTSNEANATPTASTATAPSAPQTLTAAPAKGKGVQLGWQAPSSDGGSPITGYAVYRGTTSGGETLLTTLGVVTSYKDTATTRGTTYYYKVAAINAVGTGPQSAEAHATAK